MRKAKIISVLNHKGGVGKTTTVANTGAGLHRLGKRVLLIDMDPQANLTLHLYGEAATDQPTIYGAMLGRYPLPIVQLNPGFDLVISTLDLSGVEIDLQNEPGREYILRELLSPVASNYDYILIDCPPSIGLITIFALSASTHTIIPVEAGTFALVGMTKLFDIIEKVKSRLNKELVSFRILITKYDSRKTIQKEISEHIRAKFGSNVFETVIPSNVALEEATMAKKSVFDTSPKSSGAENYLNVCREILQ